MGKQEPDSASGVTGLAERDEAAVFRSVLDTSNIATVVLGPDFSVEWANERVEDYLGIPREELIGEDKASLVDSRIKSVFERPDRFAEKVIGTFEDDSQQEAFECHVLPGENRAERWLEHRSNHIDSGQLSGGRIEHYLDITERKQRESRLSKTQERLELAAHGTATGIWEWDMDTDEVFWTDELERMTGLEPGEFEGTFAAFADRVHPADMADVEAAIEETIEHGSMYKVEFRLERGDGTYRWVEARGQVVEGDDPPRMVGTVTDISQRKEREQQYERLTERISSGYYALDNDWTITYWNDVMEERQGVPADEMVGENFWERRPEIEGTEMAATLREAMESGEERTCEFYYEEMDYWTKLRVFPDGNGISVLSTEITERKEREAELERTHEFLEETQKAGEIGGWEVDLRTDELRWTDEVFRIHGVSRSYEPTLEEAFEFYYPDDRAKIEAAYERATTEGEPYDLELRMVTQDDDVRWVRTTGSPMYDDGEIVGVRGMMKDITDRRRRLSAVLENAPVVLFRIDSDGVFTESQGKPLEKLGLEPGEAVGESVYDLYADYPEIIDGIERALDGEEVRVTAEIGELTFESEYRPVTDDDGDVREVVGVSFDITERVQQERRLEENDAILTQLTETTDDVFWLFDSDFTEVQFVNDAYEEVWGRSIEDLHEDSMDFMEGVHPDDRELVTSTIGRLQAGESTEVEYRVNPEEDFERWVSVRGDPIFDDEGNVVRAAGYARDITERKERERQLRELSEATQELSLAQTPDEVAEQVVSIAADVLQLPVTALWKYDQEDERLFPWEATAQALELAGADDPEGIGSIETGTFEMETFRAGEPTIAADYQSLANPSHPEVPIGSLLLLPVGEYALLNVAAAETDAFDDAQQNLLSILANNAETAFRRAEREEALETYKNSLEQSNENLQEFAYVASHDLQEPLRSVTSYLDLLETEYGDALDQEGEFYIDRAISNAEQMSSLIDALLEYSRVKTDEGEFEEVSVESVLEDTLDGVTMRIEESGAQITTGPLPTVVADRDQLGQVFQNLVVNAIDHGGDPPEIEITAEKDDDGWVFAVSDNGPGIPETQHDRIFEIFQQANTDGDGKAGIGLAICERIVSRHQGEIWVESTESGSTFKFTIPQRRTS